MSTARLADHVDLGGIPLAPMSLARAFESIVECARRPGPMEIVATVNLQLMRTARTNEAFARVLQHETALNLVDGWPVAWLLRRRGVTDAITAPGADLTLRLLKSAEARELGIYLLGDATQTLQDLAERASSEGWATAIRGAESPPQAIVDDTRGSEAIVSRINASGAKVLLVAFGAPRQELWLARWRPALIAKVGVGIGGSLKFVAWPRRRAPAWMRHNGLEWLHRLALEPGRLMPRYLKDASELARLATSEIGARRS